MVLRPNLQCVSKHDTDVTHYNCSVVHWLTPLLHGIGCVLSGTTKAIRIEESTVQGVPGRSIHNGYFV